jgi:hypothetical protein
MLINGIGMRSGFLNFAHVLAGKLASAFPGPALKRPLRRYEPPVQFGGVLL